MTAEVTTYIPPDQAAQFLLENYGSGSVRSLAKARCYGGGPGYRQFGRRVLYTRSALVAWAEAKLSAPRRSTSDQQETTKGKRRGRPKRADTAVMADGA